jgi:hypothetical protein
MSGTTAADQAAYLASLSAAVDAAEATFFAAAVLATEADKANLQALMAALDHTKAAFNSALSESLARNSSFVKSEQAALDAQVARTNADLAKLQSVVHALELLTEIAKLAGSLATAFA